MIIRYNVVKRKECTSYLNLHVHKTKAEIITIVSNVYSWQFSLSQNGGHRAVTEWRTYIHSCHRKYHIHAQLDVQHTHTTVTEWTTYTHNCHTMEDVHTILTECTTYTQNSHIMYHIYTKLSHNVPHTHKTLT